MVGADFGGADRVLADGPGARPPAPPPTRRDWAAAHDRRVQGARLARRLQPAAEALGGFASSRLRVRLRGQREHRPAAAIVRGAPPADGVVEAPPELVVVLAPGDPRWWLDVGTPTVWVVGPGDLHRHTPSGITALAPGDVVAVGETRLAVDDLLRAGGHRTVPRR